MPIEDPTKNFVKAKEQSEPDAEQVGSTPEKRDFNEVLEMFEKARGKKNFNDSTYDIVVMLNDWDSNASKSLRDVYPGWEREDFKELLDELGVEFTEYKSLVEEEMDAKEAGGKRATAEAVKGMREKIDREVPLEEQDEDLKNQIKQSEWQLESTRRNAPKIIFDRHLRRDDKMSWYEYEPVMNERIEHAQKQISTHEEDVVEQQKIIYGAKGFFKKGKIKRAEEIIERIKPRIRERKEYLSGLESELEKARQEHEKTEVAEKERELLKKLEDLKNKQAELKK